MPSDMTLQPDNVQGYNNLIRIAGSDVVIENNPGINEVEPVNPAFEVDRLSKGRPPHEPGPFTRGRSLRPRRIATARLLQVFRRKQPKTALVAAGIAVDCHLANQSRAAMRNRVPVQSRSLSERPQEPRDEPMIPGRFTHSFKPLLSDGLGGGVGALLPPTPSPAE